MEDKKRKRAQDDDALVSDSDHAAKKAKYDHLFSTHAVQPGPEARATYIASQAAQDVLAAIARGDSSAISAGQAPPDLDKSLRKQWRNLQRRLALQNASSSDNAEREGCIAEIEDLAATSNPVDPGGIRKQAKGDLSLTPIGRDDLAALFFAGVACQLDESATKAFLESQDAEHAIAAVLRGDGDAITASHAPPGLAGKKARLKWRQEQRLLAQRQRDILLSNSARSVGENVSLDLQTSANIGVNVEQSIQATTSDERVPSSAPSSNVAMGPSKLDSRSTGFTALARPPVKVWNQTDGFTTNEVTNSTTHTSVVKDQHPSSSKIVLDQRPHKERLQMQNSVSAPPVALGSSSRRSSLIPNGMLHHSHSTESASHVVPRRLPGDRNFDAPDYFARGSLADTERRFEAWARAQRGGESDSSDSDSDETSDEDEAPSPKPVVRGSFHESWADQIRAKSDKQLLKAKDEHDQAGVDEAVSSSSESSEASESEGDNDDHEEEDDVEVQTQVSRELQEATNASTHNVSDDDQQSPAAPAEITVHVPDSQNTEDLSVSVGLPPAKPSEAPSRRTIDPPALTNSKVQPPTPDQQAPGTPHGHPNAIRQANVRVKRILSHTNPGGYRSGHGPSEVVKPVTRSSLVRSGRQAVGVGSNGDHVDRGELSDDVYDAIDDVTSDLLSSTKENIPSMDECKPDTSNGQDMDLNLTTGSAIETPDLGEREDLMEGLQDVKAEVNGPVRAKEEKADGVDGTNHEEGDNGQDAAKGPTESRRRSTSDSSSLSELSRTPSLPSEPQVIIPAHVPETPEMKHEESMRMKRKMTGNSSKRFGSGKRARSSRKSSALDNDLSVMTPTVHARTAQEDSSSVYVTAVSRRTRSAFKESRLDEAEAIDTSDGEADTPAEHIPSTALEDTLDLQAPGVDSTDAEVVAAKDGSDERSEGTPKSRPGNTDSLEQETPFITPPEPPSTILPSTPQAQPTKGKSRRPKSKSTGRISNHFITDRVDLYDTTSTTPSKRLVAGVSHKPIPPTSAPTFGIVQEKLYREPFWLLIAVTFLNKTAGRSAGPIFWKLKEKYQTAEALAEADQMDLLKMVHRLGLQNQRSKRLIKIAKAWSEDPPVKGRRFRTLNYPCLGDGKAKDVPKVVEEDVADCTGALEIGHIPGCGEYAWDSWRIFCRDILRGVADDYIGTHAEDDFEPEWKRVLPKDKELRACLRWMWVKEGFIWDPLTGDKRPVTDEERHKAERGEMEIWDPGEAKFAVQAAAATARQDLLDETPSKVGTAEVDRLEAEFASSGGERSSDEGEGQDKDGEDGDYDENESDMIHVTPRRPPSRTAKVSRTVEQDGDDEKVPISKPKPKSRKSTPAKSSKRKARTSSFRADDEEEYEVGKGADGKKKRRSRRLTAG